MLHRRVHLTSSGAHMSLSAASMVALVLYALALAPLAWLSTSHGKRTVAAGYMGFVVIVAIYQTGIFHSASLAPTNSVVQVLAPADEEKCRQIMDLLERSSLRVDRSDPDSPKI